MCFPLEPLRDFLEPPEPRLRRFFSFSFFAFSSLISSRMSACVSTNTWCCAPAGSPGERGA